jgi:hypothetical protein
MNEVLPGIKIEDTVAVKVWPIDEVAVTVAVPDDSDELRVIVGVVNRKTSAPDSEKTTLFDPERCPVIVLSP